VLIYLPSFLVLILRYTCCFYNNCSITHKKDQYVIQVNVGSFVYLNGTSIENRIFLPDTNKESNNIHMSAIYNLIHLASSVITLIISNKYGSICSAKNYQFPCSSSNFYLKSRYIKFDTFTPAAERGLPVTRVISRMKLQQILARAVGDDVILNGSNVIDFVDDGTKVS